MQRFNRFIIVFLVGVLPWVSPWPGRAEPPAPMPPSLPGTAESDVRRLPPALPTAPGTVEPNIGRNSAPEQSAAAPPAYSAPKGDQLPPTLPPPRPTETATPVSEGQVNLKTPCPEAADQPLPITLAAALKLADARPLIIAAAQASAWVAEAQLQRAKVLWVPTLNLGFDYLRHDGFGPDFNRALNTAARPLNQNINFFYGGGGLTLDVYSVDAVFQPLASRQVLNATRFDIQAAKNDALLQTADAYFRVHQYRGMYAGALDVVERGHKLVHRLEQLSKDLVPRIEVDRAKNMLADFEQNAASAREGWRVASADLTLALRLDPRAVIVPLEHDHLQITLIDPTRSLDELIPIGLTNRPELASQQALVQATLVRIRQEKLRPLIPSVLLYGFQTPGELLNFGAQGIGSDNHMNLWSTRFDYSPQALWRFEGMGFGNMARIKEQRGEQSRAIVQLFRVQDRVAADVTRTQARLQSAAVRVVQAERSLRQAIITYDGNYEGLRQTRRFGNVLIQIYRPQEVVIALDRLRTAYDEYFGTVADYNRAEFQMFHALGFPAQELSNLHPPGEAGPVDTARPGYMPPVGSGPPPATR